jgi:dipeptidyl aminopeptidase/acylaminoacyl peptidase
MKILRNVVILVATLYLALLVILFFQQRNLIYLRSAPPVDPATVGLSDVEVVSISTPDGETLVGWWSPPQPGKPTVLFLHGNAGTVADRSDALAFYRSNGLGTLFLDYRGYGGSTGTPSESGLIADALAAYDWLLSRGVTPDKIGVVGESVGSGPAVALATTRPISALALEAPFSSMADVAAHHYPWLPEGLLLCDR